MVLDTIFFLKIINLPVQVLKIKRLRYLFFPFLEILKSLVEGDWIPHSKFKVKIKTLN